MLLVASKLLAEGVQSFPVYPGGRRFFSTATCQVMPSHGTCRESGAQCGRKKYYNAQPLTSGTA
jgi:hypothetical protein